MDGYVILVIAVLALILIFSMSGDQKAPSNAKKNKASKNKEKTSQKKEEEKLYQYYLSRFDPQYSVRMAPIVTPVAGVRYKNDDTQVERQSIIRKCKIGEKLMLIPDELNKFDRDAIKVVRLNGEQIGFLNTDLALEIKARLQQRLRVDVSIKSITEEKGIREVDIEMIKYSRRSS